MNDLSSFQTCMNFFLLLNIKEDILKNVGNQKTVGPHWTKILWKLMGTEELFGYQHSLHILFFPQILAEEKSHTDLEQLEGEK